MENQAQENTIFASLETMISQAIEAKTKEILDKKYPYANRGLISVKEAAKYLNYGEATIIQMIEDGTPLRISQ
jgi:hypothetical protein